MFPFRFRQKYPNPAFRKSRSGIFIADLFLLNIIGRTDGFMAFREEFWLSAENRYGILNLKVTQRGERIMVKLRERYGSFINGVFTEQPNGAVVEDRNPSDGSVLASLCLADEETLEQAVKAASEAFSSWGTSDQTYRAEILNKMADVMDENREYLASIEARDVGKPIGEATLQMQLSASMYRYFAAAILSQDETMVLHDGGSISAVIREPLGVVGLILPWNAPAMLLSWKAAPALAAGNCVVAKPASAAPLVTLELARLWADVIPAGVFNVLIASGSGTAVSIGSRTMPAGFTVITASSV